MDPLAASWPPGLTMKIAEALSSLSEMEEPGSRALVVRILRAKLGGKLTVPFSNEMRQHCLEIASACVEHENAADAVHELWMAVSYIARGNSSLSLLKECDEIMNGCPALTDEQLGAVMKVIHAIFNECARLPLWEIAEGLRRHPEGNPVRFTDTPAEAVERLNSARLGSVQGVPLLVRFLAAMADRMDGAAGARLSAEVNKIAHELQISPGDIDTSVPSVPSGSTMNALQIRIDDNGPPGTPRYAISAAMFLAVSPSGRTLGSRKNCHEACVNGHSMREVEENVFADLVGEFSGPMGVGECIVEFILPAPLLGFPVELLKLPGTNFPIGRKFAVVVGSLDRRRPKYGDFFFKEWVERWNMLFIGSGNELPVGKRIGWLHNGGSGLPGAAGSAGRVINMTGDFDLPPWLARGNEETPGLGLTFPYAPDDPYSETSIRNVIVAGIPLLVWCRDSSNMNVLQDFLDEVDIRSLSRSVIERRKMDVNCDIVLMLDDPYEARQPSSGNLAAPRRNHGR